MNWKVVFGMQKLVPIVRNAGEGDKQLFAGGGLHLWKLLAEDTGGAFFLFEDTMVKDKTTPLHLHPEAHEMTYVVDGEIEVQADGQRSRVRTGGMSFVPKGVAHAFIVVSAEARLIGIQSPGTPGQAFYRGASDPATDDTDPSAWANSAATHSWVRSGPLQSRPNVPPGRRTRATSADARASSTQCHIDDPSTTSTPASGRGSDSAWPDRTSTSGTRSTSTAAMRSSGSTA